MIDKILKILESKWYKLFVATSAFYYAFKLVLFPGKVSDGAIQFIGFIFFVYSLMIFIDFLIITKSEKDPEKERGIHFTKKCYKTEKECKHNCSGLCKESC